MKQYLELLAEVRRAPARGDRTGTGTHSVFGRQLRFDLNAGFPLLTTKRVNFRPIVNELLWFISGSTDNKELNRMGTRIWDEWATPEQTARFGREEGDLGPIYGWAWRNFGRQYPLTIQQPEPRLREGLTPTYLGVGNGAGKEGHPLAKRWEGMMSRCYNPNANNYQRYGKRGVSVCDQWLEFKVFANDAAGLPGWDNLTNNVELDKDGLGDGLVYCAENCRWVTSKENSALRDPRIFVLERVSDGTIFRVTNVQEFCEQQGITAKNMSDLWTGNKNAKMRSGFKLIRVEDQRCGFDQLADVVAQIRRNPESRRLIVSGWNPKEATQVALPPCHTLFQFYVSDGKLSCQLYQRSADIFLGVPFNIASYALLTHMIAHVTKLGVGEFVHTFGDVHLYLNHEDQADLQLSREPREPARLVISNQAQCLVDELEHFNANDFDLIDYLPHPSIKAPVSV